MSIGASVTSTGAAPYITGALPPVDPTHPWLQITIDPVAIETLMTRIGFSWTVAGVASVSTNPDLWLEIDSNSEAEGYDPIYAPSVATATSFALFGIVGVNFTLTRVSAGIIPAYGT